MTYPYIAPDDTYDKQRKCRMQDAIDDYLQDDEVDARRAYEEMLSCVQDVIDYHQKEYVKARELYDLMTGNR
jgi:predicted house-cleaning noncanonical NTP pyrophosphatase (MazG superfamily)